VEARNGNPVGLARNETVANDNKIKVQRLQIFLQLDDPVIFAVAQNINNFGGKDEFVRNALFLDVLFLVGANFVGGWRWRVLAIADVIGVALAGILVELECRLDCGCIDNV